MKWLLIKGDFNSMPVVECMPQSCQVAVTQQRIRAISSTAPAIVQLDPTMISDHLTAGCFQHKDVFLLVPRIGPF